MIRISDKEFRLLTDLIKRHYGIQLKKEKVSLLSGRLQVVLQQLGFDNFTDYLDYLTNDRTGEAMKTLVNKVSTNHTFFMREPGHFDFFRETVLPRLSRTVRERDLRIWSAGCSTGEEPYTLAMILDQFFGLEKRQWDTKVLATDISSHVIETAKAGRYERERVELLPRLWQRSYFNLSDGNQLEITPALKQEVIFRTFNLMETKFPFKRKFHTIFCRNVMIYFDAPTRNELISRFYEWMEPGGYLFIGHSESITRDSTKFKYVRPAVYRKE